MAIHRIVSVSTPNLPRMRPTYDTALSEILRVSLANNAASGLSGILVASHDHFVEVLEGPRSALTETVARILRDPRHRDVRLFDPVEAQQRYFAEWSMHFGRLDALDPAIFFRVHRSDRVDPYAMTADQLVALAYALAECPASSSPLLRLDRLVASTSAA